MAWVLKVLRARFGEMCVTHRTHPPARHPPGPCGTEEEERLMSAPASPTVRRRRLAAELREIREDKGKSGEAVAAALRWSPSKISRYERARTGLRPKEVARLLDYYQVTGPRRDRLLGVGEGATEEGWWEKYGDHLVRGYPPVNPLRERGAFLFIWHVDV